MRCGMVLSGKLRGNYAVDNVGLIHGLQVECDSLVRTVGRTLAEVDAQLEARITEFI